LISFKDEKSIENGKSENVKKDELDEKLKIENILKNNNIKKDD